MFRSIRRFMFFFLLVLLIFYILFEVIADQGLGTFWPLILIYSAIIGFMAYSYYKEEVMEELVGEFESLRSNIEKSRFKTIEERDNTFLLKPKFDYPYSLFSGDKVNVSFTDEKATIEGPKYYVEGLVKDIRGDMNIVTRLLSRTSIVFFLFIVMIYPLIPLSGAEWDLRQLGHNLKIKVTSVDVIEFEDDDAVGNRPGNINNQGISAENEDYIFYVHDHQYLVRTDKNFQNSIELTSSTNGPGIYDLNIIDDYIFYSKGDEYHRMGIDGSNDQTFYNMSNLHKVHIRGNWIYFINSEDDFTIYKMDINGQNLDRFLNLPVTDFTVFEDRLYFSHPAISEGYGRGRIESISLEGYDRQVEFDAIARNMTIYDGYCYYIGPGDKLYRSELNNDKRPELLVSDGINSYIITDVGIYYTKFWKDEPDFINGDGLYRIHLDGDNEELLLDSEIFGHLNHAGDYILFSAYDEDYYPHPHRLNLITGDLDVIEYEYN